VPPPPNSGEALAVESHSQCLRLGDGPLHRQLSAVVPKVALWFLVGDTMATEYGKVSPESRAGKLNASQTVAPREHFSGGYAASRAGFWHNLRKLITTDFGPKFPYYLADANLLIQFRAYQ